MIRALLRWTLLLSVPVLLASCRDAEQRSLDVQLLATDVHVAVAQHVLVLPFVALDDYAYGKQSFSLNRKADSDRAADQRTTFLRQTRDPQNPLELDQVSVTVRVYGASDFDSRRSRVCARLSRQWARSVCDNPWDPTQRALPPNRFKLVDLGRFRLDDPRGPANCLEDSKRNSVPSSPGRGLIVCPALVFGSDEDKFHTAVVRIDGDLGATWLVWRNGQGGESAQVMARREGKAIALFVQAALGEREDYPKLRRGMCDLRRPAANDDPSGAHCLPTSAASRRDLTELQGGMSALSRKQPLAIAGLSTALVRCGGRRPLSSIAGHGICELCGYC